MSQTTFDDDELFEEAAGEVRADVEAALSAARAALPDEAAVWAVEADNVLGVLNGLRSALDVGDAAEELQEAKKWYAMGSRAGAFEDGDDLAAEIAALDELFERIEEARVAVSDLTSALPELRNELEGAHGDDE